MKKHFTISDLLSMCVIGLMTLCIGVVSLCGAQTIYLKDGRIIEGSVVRETENTIWIEMPGGKLGIARSDIEKIEGESRRRGVQGVMPECIRNINNGKFTSKDYMDLSGVRDYKAAPALINLLYHKHDGVRKGAMEALSETPNTKILSTAIPDIIQAWEKEADRKDVVRYRYNEYAKSADFALSRALQTESSAVEIAKAFLQTRHEKIKTDLYRLIVRDGKYGNKDPRITLAAFKVMFQDSDSRMRQYILAEVSINYLEYPEALPIVKAGLNDSVSKNRGLAAFAMHKMSDVEKTEETETARGAAFTFDEVELTKLLSLVRDSDKHVRSTALLSLRKMMKQNVFIPSLEQLKKITYTPDEEVLKYAITCLGTKHTGESVSLLLDVFQRIDTMEFEKKGTYRRYGGSPHEQLQAKALDALKGIDDEDAFAEAGLLLREIFRSTNSTYLRNKALDVSVQAGRYGLPVLFEAWKEGDKDVARMAQAKLRKSFESVDVRVLGYVIDLFAEVDPVLQDRIAHLLLKVKDKSVIPLLIDKLSKQEGPAQEKLVSVLKKLTGRDFGSNAGQWQQWWEKDEKYFEIRWF